MEDGLFLTSSVVQRGVVGDEVALSFAVIAPETHSGSKPKNLVGAVEDFEVDLKKEESKSSS